jgi:hypothetical protein
MQPDPFLILAVALIGGVAFASLGLVELYRLIVRIPTTEDLARVMAKADGLDWREACGYESGQDDCDSGSCIAAHFEDHDAEWARTVYLRRADAVLDYLRGQI